MKIGIIGGGAAGFFAAITCAESNPDNEIIIFEKTNKLLSKVRISGGGRCNVTNACSKNYELIKNYPRGYKELKNLFSVFSTQQTIKWFYERGVELKAESDNRIFPVTDNSQTIIDCFLREARDKKIQIETGTEIIKIEKSPGYFNLITNRKNINLDKILIATGGNSKIQNYDWLKELNHEIVPPVPSLFTFNIPGSKLNGLQGISVENATIKIQNTKEEQSGPILITHWGLSGPAVLRLSAWEARALADLQYKFRILVNWIPPYKEENLREYLIKYKSEHSKKVIYSNPLFDLPKRLWERIADISEISKNLKWGDAPNKKINKLIEELIRCSFEVKGKTTFKEEFVTCGGISLKDINLESMESKNCPRLYFAGEVLNIDGITGGFNFQAAWTTGYIAGKAMANKLGITSGE